MFLLTLLHFIANFICVSGGVGVPPLRRELALEHRTGACEPGVHAQHLCLIVVIPWLSPTDARYSYLSRSTQILPSATRVGKTVRAFSLETIARTLPTPGGQGLQSLTSPLRRSKALWCHWTNDRIIFCYFATLQRQSHVRTGILQVLPD
jgi:hypothetical protein